MVVWWIIGGAVGVLTAVGSLICWKSPKARRGLKRARTKTFRKVKGVTKSAWTAHKKARASTARGQLRARRAKQPHRLTFGHRRTAEDETRSRRAARLAGQRTKAGAAGLVEKARLVRMNRRPKAKGRVLKVAAASVLNGPGAKAKSSVRSRSAESMYVCGAKNRDGLDCANLQMRGPDGKGTGACYIRDHQRQVAGSSQRAS